MSSETMNKIIKALGTAHILSPRRLASLRYRLKFHRWPNIDHPSDLNEKILALMFRTDTSEWTRLADKYAVREYVESKGLGHILPALYGVYDRVDEIDFESLPERCAVKTTSSCGCVLIYDGENRPEPEEAHRKLKKWLRGSYGYITAEPHYTHIKNRIIVEELIQKDDPAAHSLTDYKIWYINGKPEVAFVCTERDIEKHKSKFDFFSLPDWKPMERYLHPTYGKSLILPRPTLLDDMIEYGKVLAGNFPLVRIDFYQSQGKVYFGEMTFSSNGGRMRYFTDEALEELGRKADLSKVKFTD